MTEYRVDERPNRAPTHPGIVLKRSVLPEIGISIVKAASELGVSRQILHRILSAKAPITSEMAVRLGKFCGNGPELWLAMQQRYDLYHAQRKLEAEVANIPTHSSTEPRYRFEVFKDNIDEWRWRLVMDNGEVMHSSTGYASKQASIRSADQFIKAIGACNIRTRQEA